MRTGGASGGTDADTRRLDARKGPAHRADHRVTGRLDVAVDDRQTLTDRGNLAVGPRLNLGGPFEDRVTHVGRGGVQSLQEARDRLEKLDGAGARHGGARAEDDHETLGRRRQQGTNRAVVNLFDDDEAEDDAEPVKATLDVRGHLRDKGGRLAAQLRRDGRHGRRARRVHATGRQLDGHGLRCRAHKAAARPEGVPHGATETADRFGRDHRTPTWLLVWNHRHFILSSKYFYFVRDVLNLDAYLVRTHLASDL